MKVKDYIHLALVILLLYGVFHILGIGCPIKYLTGISCAGCGMTRSWLCVLRFDFSAAFYYHPLFWIPPFALVCVIYKQKMSKRLYNTMMFFIALMFIAVYLIRILDPEETVVKIDINDGAISRCIKFILGGGVRT